MSNVIARYAHEEQCRKMRLPLTYDSDQNMVVSIGGPHYRPQNTTVLIKRAPQMGTLHFGKLPYLIYRALTHILKPSRQLGFQKFPKPYRISLTSIYVHSTFHVILHCSLHFLFRSLTQPKLFQLLMQAAALREMTSSFC